MHLLSKQKDPVSAKKDKMIENKNVVCWFKGGKQKQMAASRNPSG